MDRRSRFVLLLAIVVLATLVVALLVLRKGPPRRDHCLHQLRQQMEAFVEQFNDLRYTVIAGINRIENEKIRKAAANLYVLDKDMALSMPESWTETRVLYGGRSPIQLQVDWQRTLMRMTGKLLRGDSIDDEDVEDNVHQQRPPVSARESP